MARGQKGRLVRHGAVSVETTGAWSGSWKWPLRVAVAAADDDQLLRRLRDTAAVQRGHASIEPFAFGESPDVLIVSGFKDLSPFRKAAEGVGALILAERPEVPSLPDLAKIRRDFKAGAVVEFTGPHIVTDDLFNGLVTELSHDHTFDDALGRAFRLKYGADQDAVPTVAVSDFLIESRLSTTYDRMISDLKALDTVPVAISADAANRFNRSGLTDYRLTVPLSSANMAAALTKSFDQVVYNQERDGATAIAAVGRALDDAKTGPGVRYADALIYEGDVPDEQKRLPTSAMLQFEATYLLEFAFRMQRVGIGYDTPPQPLAATVDATTTLLVAVSAAPGSKMDIPHPVQAITISPEGDSEAARFVFRCLAGAVDPGQIEIRVFSKLNLIEYVLLDVKTGAMQRVTDKPAQRLHQPDRFLRYQGTLSAAQPPVDLSIDVATDDGGFRLCFASGKGDAIKAQVRVELAREDLQRDLGEVRDIWLDIGLDVFAKDLKAATTYSGREQLRGLAQAGQRLWQLLFCNGPADGSAWAFGEDLRANPLPDGAYISVRILSNAREFTMPWQLLYDRDVPDKGDIDPSGFWGVRYVVTQQLANGAPQPVRTPTPSGGNLAVFIEGTIAQSPAQVAFTSTAAAAAVRPLSVTVGEGRGELEGRLTAGDDRLLYFFCHGSAAVPYPAWAGELENALAAKAAENPVAQSFLTLIQGDRRLNGSQSSIKLTRNFIELRDLSALGSRFRHNPIVFLNMCESAQLFPDAGRSFISVFLNRFAGAVIGTECPVPPVFAAAMGEHMLPQLLAGTTAGNALLVARRDMLNNHGNPLGLAYALWGDAASALA